MKLQSKNDIEQFVKQNGLFPKNSQLIITDILSEIDESEGLVNQIYQVKDQNKSLVIKQVLPFALAIKKEVGVEHPMDPERINLETKALIFLNTFWNSVAPEIFKLDTNNGLIVMEDLTHLNNLRFELPKGKVYPTFGIQLGTLLAGLRYYTSDLYLNPQELREFQEFFDNQTHRENMTNMILGPESPLFKAENFEESVWPIQKKAYSDPAITREVERIRTYLINSHECFSHMDLHIGNILVDDHEVKIIDSEFSGIGTSFMDLGRLSSSFLINYFAWLFESPNHPQRIEMMEYNLQIIFDLFESYLLTLKQLIPNSYESIYAPVLKDSIRLMVLSLILRLQNGIALSYDISKIKSLEKRAQIQEKAFELLIQTFYNVDGYSGIYDFISELEEFSENVNQL